MNTTHPPVGPTEQEVREHFTDKIPVDARLLRPAYTSIWALEDGTLLWDYKNGYAQLGPKLKCIMYVTGLKGSGKSSFASLLDNAVELPASEIIKVLDEMIIRHEDCKTLCITSRKEDPMFSYNLEAVANSLKVFYKHIKL